jgi:type IV pilus assembly protein PilB
MLKFPIKEEELEKIIIDSGLVAKDELESAQKTAKALNIDFSDILIEKSIITEDYLGQIIANYFKVPFVSLKNRSINNEILELVPEEVAEKYQIIPFQKQKNKLFLAMINPENFEAINFVKKSSGLSVVVYFIMPEDWRKALAGYKKDIKKDFEKIVNENLPKTKKEVSETDLKKAAAELSIVKIFDEILDYASSLGASDVHFENLADILVVRFRIDGILRDIINLPKEVAPALIARIKVLANLKIDEQRLPQDGRFKYSQKYQELSIRVSIVPSFFGEDISIRILFESARAMNLSDLGIIEKNLELIKENIKQTKGMILITGPTGSGKTTTLYSILNILNSPEIEICTIEDPIEYSIPRLTQIQVNPKIGLTFASGLRSLLRHDPDVIMVGEIRDKETAEIATHASLTGHLVLSTLHTMDAPSAMPRLLDMGVPPYLITSTVNLVITQRLARRICPSCIEVIKDDKTIKNNIIKEFGNRIDKKSLLKQKFYKGIGCSECADSGYRGRIGIFEIMEINEEIEKQVLEKKPTSEIFKIATKKGMINLVQDGIFKAAKGLIPLEEVLRVTRE